MSPIETTYIHLIWFRTKKNEHKGGKRKEYS